MKILFALSHAGYLRHYESTIVELAQRRHEIHLVFSSTKRLDRQEGVRLRRLAGDYPGITYGIATFRNDIWAPLADIVRGCMDTLRYANPRYDNSPKLRARVKVRTGIPVGLFLLLPAWLSEWLLRLFRCLEANISSHRDLDQCLTQGHFDKVLVTPLVEFASRQEEYVKSARKLGLPVAVCVASWDNLTNKGLIRQNVDAAMVWNQLQQDEAVEMHGIPRDRVFITGAQTYDQWFERKPRDDYAVFCARVGLNPEHPFILYLCSTKHICDDQEPNFINRWVDGLRNSRDKRLREMGVLVRPHYENMGAWSGYKIRASNFAVYPENGANPITDESRADYFDSMYHCSAVVGINTSGMVESSILGKPILTLSDGKFEAAQTGTLHFRHLRRLGLLMEAKSLSQHHEQLAQILDRKPAGTAGNEDFVRSFIRPYGLDQSAVPLLVSAIESYKRCDEPEGEQSYFYRILLFLILPVTLIIWYLREIVFQRVPIWRTTKHLVVIILDALGIKEYVRSIMPASSGSC